MKKGQQKDPDRTMRPLPPSPRIWELSSYAMRSIVMKKRQQKDPCHTAQMRSTPSTQPGSRSSYAYYHEKDIVSLAYFMKRKGQQKDPDHTAQMHPLPASGVTYAISLLSWKTCVTLAYCHEKGQQKDPDHTAQMCPPPLASGISMP